MDQANAQTISWSKEEGPSSGAIALLTVNMEGDIFVVTDAFGIYRSTDGGGTWQSMNNGLDLFYESVLLADSSNNLYTGNISSGLYASTDKGASWSKTSYVGDVQCVAAISGNRICVGGRQTVSISNDIGKTWSSSQVTTDTRVEVASIAEDNLGDIYAGLQSYHPEHPPAPAFGGGVYISSDSGKTWEYYGLATTTVSSIVKTIGEKIIISSSLGILSAGPKSNKWTEDDAGIPHGSYALDTIRTLLSDNLGQAVAVTNIGMFVYGDSVATWKSVTPDVSLASITSGYYNPKGTSYAGTDWNGVFLMESSSMIWVQCGIDSRPVTSVGFDGLGRLFAGTEDGVFQQRAKDGAWLRVSDGLTHSTVYQLYYSASSKRLYASTARGASYLPDNENYWIPVTEQWTYNFIEFPDSTKYTGTNGGILTSVGEGDLWTIVHTIGLPATSIYCLALDSSNNLFAGTSLNGVFMSTDGGTFWTQSGISSPFIFYSVKALAVDREGRIIAGTDTSGAFTSDDQGINWTSIPSIAGKDVTCFALDNPSLYFAGTLDRGIFVSTDRGLNWHSANNGLTDSSILSIAFDQNGTLHAGTSEGMYTSTVVTSRIEDKNNVPSKFSLFQNYPNPFNPATVISYQLSVNSLVTLKVYDVLGRLVKTLIEERQTSGIHSVPFNAGSLSSGIYFFRLAAGSYVETKKMILIK